MYQQLLSCFPQYRYVLYSKNTVIYNNISFRLFKNHINQKIDGSAFPTCPACPKVFTELLVELSMFIFLCTCP